MLMMRTEHSQWWVSTVKWGFGCPPPDPYGQANTRLLALTCMSQRLLQVVDHPSDKLFESHLWTNDHTHITLFQCLWQLPVAHSLYLRAIPFVASLLAMQVLESITIMCLVCNSCELMA